MSENKNYIPNEKEGAAPNIMRVEEQRARLHLGIPLYRSETDKKSGAIRPLSVDEQRRVDEYLGLPHEKSSEAATETIEGKSHTSMMYEELSEMIGEHRRHLESAYVDIRGRLGIGEAAGLAPDPGSDAERKWLSKVVVCLKEELSRLQREGRVAPGDASFEDISRSLDTFTEYVQHRKAYLGLSVYRKERFSSREAEREKRDREKEKSDLILQGFIDQLFRQ